ncbi:hypothetical protein [Pustulibacterium marinum]|nr:hypothetical protein [Pustulibacterium marinum]
MKLVIITAITEFSTDIKLILKKAGVQAFSCQNVTGYKDVSNSDIEGNWFAGEMIANDSIMCYAFAYESQIEQLMNMIDDFNASQDFITKVHAVQVPIEKTNTLNS